MTDGFDAMADLARQVPRLPRRELRCGPGVIMRLRLTMPEAEPSPPWSGTVGNLTGIPVIESPGLGRGDWEIIEDGEVTASGHIEVPEFVTRPIELPAVVVPGLTSRLACSAMLCSVPLSPFTITGV